MEPYHQRLMTAGAAAGIGYKLQSDRAEINWFSGIADTEPRCILLLYQFDRP
jgi:hypothetical protein